MMNSTTVNIRRLLLILSIGAITFLDGCSEEKNSENVVNKFTILNGSFVEENDNHVGEIRILIDGSLASDISVFYEIDEESATFGNDFIQSNGEIFFRPGELEATIPVEIIGDEHFELSEIFALRLTFDGKTTLFNISITDDDEMMEILSDEQGFYTPAEYPSMNLKWSDEFEGDELNTADWTYEIGDGCPNLCGWGNDELETYTDEEANSRVEDGNLIITARKENGDYTSARIKTQDKVELLFGRIDVRAKLPKGQGIWPAIWMLGANIDQVSWPASGELDIMELVGHEPAVVHGTVHFDNNGYQSSTGSRMLNNGDFSDQFHVFSVVWERDRIRWYVDNQIFKTFTKSGSNGNPFNAPFFFIMNIAVGGSWPGNPDGTTVFPQEMVVDYIRVFH